MCSPPIVVESPPSTCLGCTSPVSNAGGGGITNGGESSNPDYTPIYIYEGEEECYADGTCTPPLYWAQVESEEVPKVITNIMIDVESTPKIEDIKKELKSFDKSKPAKLTIFVEQAIENSREVTARLGHTFVGIEQEGIIRHLGFYPDNGGGANLISNQNSEIHDNSGSPFHVSITIQISSGQLSSIINYIENYPTKYDLNNYNCSDFGIGVASLGGLNLPSTIGVGSQFGIVLFEGRNPGDLGEDMRNFSLPSGATRNLVGGNTPARSGI